MKKVLTSTGEISSGRFGSRGIKCTDAFEGPCLIDEGIKAQRRGAWLPLPHRKSGIELGLGPGIPDSHIAWYSFCALKCRGEFFMGYRFGSYKQYMCGEYNMRGTYNSSSHNDPLASSVLFLFVSHDNLSLIQPKP